MYETLHDVNEAKKPHASGKPDMTKKPKVRLATSRELAFVERYKKYTKENENN